MRIPSRELSVTGSDRMAESRSRSIPFLAHELNYRVFEESKRIFSGAALDFFVQLQIAHTLFFGLVQVPHISSPARTTVIAAGGNAGIFSLEMRKPVECAHSAPQRGSFWKYEKRRFRSFTYCLTVKCAVFFSYILHLPSFNKENKLCFHVELDLVVAPFRTTVAERTESVDRAVAIRVVILCVSVARLGAVRGCRGDAKWK